MQVKAGVEQAFGDSMNRVRVDYKLRVHTVPGNLTQLAPNQQHLQEMSAIYRKAMESRLLMTLSCSHFSCHLSNSLTYIFQNPGTLINQVIHHRSSPMKSITKSIIPTNLLLVMCP